jgi:hypothetical protein
VRETILIIVAISLIKCHSLEERVISQKNACLEKKLAGWVRKSKANDCEIDEYFWFEYLK